MREALQRVAANFPDAPPITGDDEAGFEVVWSNGHAVAGLRTFEKQVLVFLDEAVAEVTSVSAATDLLRGIFEDRIVAVAACPGFVPQTLGATKTSLAHFFYNKVLMLIPAARTADVSGRELADLALGPNVKPGAFYADGAEMRSSDESYDDAKARRLWDLSEQWTGNATAV